MNDRELASEAIRLCKQFLVESMTKSSALAALLELHPRLSDGRFLNKNVLEAVMAESRSAAEQTVAEPFWAIREGSSRRYRSWARAAQASRQARISFLLSDNSPVSIVLMELCSMPSRSLLPDR